MHKAGLSKEDQNRRKDQESKQMARKSPCSKGTGANDLEGRKQLETRSSGGGCSQKGSLPILPAKDRACGDWDVLAKDRSTGDRNLSVVLSTEEVCEPSSV